MNSKSLTCDCPFCPLKDIDLQICDLKIRLNKTGADLSWPKDTPSKYQNNPLVIKNLIILALWARNNCKLNKKDYQITVSKEDNQGYTMNIQCLAKDFYKICFHNYEYNLQAEQDTKAFTKKN